MEKELKQKIARLLKQYDHTINPYANPKIIKNGLFNIFDGEKLVLLEENKIRIYDEKDNQVMYLKSENSEYYFLAYRDEQLDIKIGHYISLGEKKYKKVDIYVSGSFNFGIEYIINKNVVILNGNDKHKTTLKDLEIIIVLLEKAIMCANKVTLIDVDKHIIK